MSKFNAAGSGSFTDDARRGFLKRSAGLGVAAALPLPLLSACIGGGDDAREGFAQAPARTHQRTLFFNLSHEDHAGHTYYLSGGGQRYALTATQDGPRVLREARQSNAFLRQVADDQITHHVTDAVLASDSVTLLYLYKDIDTAAGTWSMSSTQFYIPPASAAPAFSLGMASSTNGLMPLSAKRRAYRVAAAASAQDLADERVLFDANSHAAAVVGVHPDLMSLDPDAAHIVHSNFIDTSEALGRLNFLLGAYGPALPQVSSGSKNASGWATLIPMLDGNGVPMRNVHGKNAGRIQYQPSLHPNLRGLAGNLILSATAQVKNAPALGADVTGATEASSFKGALWLRRDGFTAIDQSSRGLRANDTATLVLMQQNPQSCYEMTALPSTDGGERKVKLKVTNWFLEFRGLYLQFFNAAGKLLTLTDIPEYVAGTITPDHNKHADNLDSMFVAMVSPVFTLAGIPVSGGGTSFEFTVPADVSTVRVLTSTLSTLDDNNHANTVLPGAVLTGVFNFGLTGLLAAAGAGIGIAVILKGVSPILQELSNELVDLLIGSAGKHPSTIVTQFATAEFWEDQSISIIKALISELTGFALETLAAKIAAFLTAGTAEDAVPVAGQIMQAVSFVIGMANLQQTNIAIANAPWTFVDDLVFRRDLTVTLVHDVRDGNFPKEANACTVTAMFDNGTPYTQILALSPAEVGPLTVVFSGVPDGGLVNVSVAFVKKASSAGGQSILLGKGSSGVIANRDGNDPTITITEFAYPIDASTVYVHRFKTALAQDGSHLWTQTAAPQANGLVCGGPGTICNFRGLTVRQSTAVDTGYVGYAWQAQNTDAGLHPSCLGAGAGQLDQLANLNTDVSGSGAKAQVGYSVAGCGMGSGGSRIAYSLLSQGGVNVYLDTTNPAGPIVRQVGLGQQVGFQAPNTNRAVGALNFPSAALLLHPAGRLVSLSASAHKLETLKLATEPVSDGDALSFWRATPIAGEGSRPGLLSHPVAAAITATGVILVLESGNNRIQALDLGGNPVRHFANQSSPYSLTLSATPVAAGWQYLDLAVEFTGLIYVLSTNTTSGTPVNRVDIYHPDQAKTGPISTTIGINAARLAVDFWRTMYTLNYEVLSLPDGTAAPFTEPSVSQWLP